jgi:NADPH-dependent 7-cyano-7-deazaguanine reductase QueF
MSEKTKAPEWLEKLFSRLAVSYGQDWRSMWAGLDPVAVQRDWYAKLALIQENKPQALAYALEHLPERVPTAEKFKALCLMAPSEHKALAAPFSKPNAKFAAEVLARLKTDLSQALWHAEGIQTALGSVGIRLIAPDDFDQQDVQELDGVNLDRLDIDCQDYTPAPQWLTAAFDEQPVSEVLTSRLLKSNCLVTGQPDWGSVQISYSGPQIEQGGLLRYLVSFRNHHEFHEQCVERIFMDVWTRCKPTRLAVYARYTRRGGLDINPFRTSHPQALPPSVRTARQ